MEESHVISSIFTLHGILQHTDQPTCNIIILNGTFVQDGFNAFYYFCKWGSLTTKFWRHRFKLVINIINLVHLPKYCPYYQCDTRIQCSTNDMAQWIPGIQSMPLLILKLLPNVTLENETSHFVVTAI